MRAMTILLGLLAGATADVYMRTPQPPPLPLCCRAAPLLCVCGSQLSSALWPELWPLSGITHPPTHPPTTPTTPTHLFTHPPTPHRQTFASTTTAWLQPGVPQSGSLLAGEARYYGVRVGEGDVGSLTVDLTPSEGDPDLYVSGSDRYPTREDYQWSSASQGAVLVYDSNPNPYPNPTPTPNY